MGACASVSAGQSAAQKYVQPDAILPTSTGGPTPLITLPTAPPYGWAKTYTAATQLATHLPGVRVPPGATVVPTTAGFNICASDGNPLTRVAIADSSKWTMPLQPGDPVVIVRGVTHKPELKGVAAELVERRGDGEWSVSTRGQTAGQPDSAAKPAETVVVPASCVAFSWWVGREMWMKAVLLQPHAEQPARRRRV